MKITNRISKDKNLSDDDFFALSMILELHTTAEISYVNSAMLQAQFYKDASKTNRIRLRSKIEQSLQRLADLGYIFKDPNYATGYFCDMKDLNAPNKEFSGYHYYHPGAVYKICRINGVNHAKMWRMYTYFLPHAIYTFANKEMNNKICVFNCAKYTNSHDGMCYNTLQKYLSLMADNGLICYVTYQFQDSYYSHPYKIVAYKGDENYIKAYVSTNPKVPFESMEYKEIPEYEKSELDLSDLDIDGFTLPELDFGADFG